MDQKQFMWVGVKQWGSVDFKRGALNKGMRQVGKLLQKSIKASATAGGRVPLKVSGGLLKSIQPIYYDFNRRRLSSYEASKTGAFKTSRGAIERVAVYPTKIVKNKRQIETRRGTRKARDVNLGFVLMHGWKARGKGARIAPFKNFVAEGYDNVKPQIADILRKSFFEALK